MSSYLKSLPHTPSIVVIAGAGVSTTLTPPRSILIITFSGMSTSCGIKDFRSRDGLYADKSTAGLFSLEFLETKPQQFYDKVNEFFLPVVDKVLQIRNNYY